jgi:colanic acid biosynthesis glycosyl transferase WcaI
MTVPSKIQSYMAFGCPIVAALDGTGAELIEDAGCGITCKAGDGSALAAAVEKIYLMNTGQRNSMGSRGKAFYLKHFQRDKLINKLNCLIIEAVESYKKI